jgi:hypothetical protein
MAPLPTLDSLSPSTQRKCLLLLQPTATAHCCSPLRGGVCGMLGLRGAPRLCLQHTLDLTSSRPRILYKLMPSSRTLLPSIRACSRRPCTQSCSHPCLQALWRLKAASVLRLLGLLKVSSNHYNLLKGF